MTDRRAQLEDLAAEIADHEAVSDAFVAKSFSDQLVIVDVAADGTGQRATDGPDEATATERATTAEKATAAEQATVPATVVERLEVADVLPVDRVYGDGERAGSPVGPIEEGTRHHFVDVRTRGTHRTEVVE